VCYSGIIFAAFAAAAMGDQYTITLGIANKVGKKKSREFSKEV
jgi:hypothetical protein